jgi:glycosyltransferase involved in cell wall biosynthesis
VKPFRVVSATLFSPRGGSAYVARALARCLRAEGIDITHVSGSRSDLEGDAGDARVFYGDIDVRAVDFAAALASGDPMTYAGRPGEAPLHPSFEDRPGQPDRVFAALDDLALRRQVAAWSRALASAGAADADVLHLHHLTPINAAAAQVAPGVPVVGHLHGTELLMLEAIADGAAWPHAEAWADRLRGWAAACARLIVAPGNEERAVELLGVPAERCAVLPNGFDPDVFRRRDVDRDAIWRRELGVAPAGPVVLYVGRFTAVKRLPLLIEAFAAIAARSDPPATLILVGGHPGEWEGEHPRDTAARLGAGDRVLLTGWRPQEALPELLCAGDVLALASRRESFGQVLVEAMACGLPPAATASQGPARILRDGETGWLVPVEDAEALAAALAHALADPAERARRGAAAAQDAAERFSWPAIAARAAAVLCEAADRPAWQARTHAASGP